MSDFWKKFKGVFVVEDPNAPQAKANEATVVKSTTSPTAPPQYSGQNEEKKTISTPTFSTSSATSVSGGQVNEKFMEVLSKAMEAANAEGYDYFEFKLALKNLAAMPMDEATRFKSAYAMAQTMGATPDKLINTATNYLSVLKTEETKFQQAAQNQMNSQVGNKQAQIENFDAVIKQKAEQIKKLTEEIDQHRAEMQQLKTDITQSTEKVQITMADFDKTYNVLVAQIQEDVTKMQQYLS